MSNSNKNIISLIIEKISSESLQQKIKIINLLLSFGCIYFIFEIFNDFISKENFEININIIEFILIFLSYLLSGAIWSNYMSSNYEGKFSLYFYNWSYSQLGKYFLSGILSVSIRLNQKLQKSKTPKALLYGLLEEQFLVSIITIPTLSIFLFINLSQYKILFLTLIFLINFFLIKKIYYKFKPEIVSMYDQTFLLIIYISIQIIIFYTIAKNLGYEDPFLISVFYYLSCSIGLFFVGVPAGIGIREFIFFFITNKTIGNYELVEFIFTTRILYIGFDLIFGLFGLFKNKEFRK